MIRAVEFRRYGPLHPRCKVVLCCYQKASIDCRGTRGDRRQMKTREIDRFLLFRSTDLIRITPRLRQTSSYARCIRRHNRWRSTEGRKADPTRVHPPTPSAPLRILVSAQPVPDQVDESWCIALAKKRSLRLRRHPDHVSHLLKLLTRIARQSKIVRPVALHHLFAVAPNAIECPQRSARCDIFPRPFRSEVGLDLGGQLTLRNVT